MATPDIVVLPLYQRLFKLCPIDLCQLPNIIADLLSIIGLHNISKSGNSLSDHSGAKGHNNYYIVTSVRS